MKKHLMMVAAAILLALPLAAQKTRWSFHVEGSLAIGNFGKADLNNNDWALISSSSTSAGAGLGWGLGVSFHKPLGNGKTSLLVSADFLYSYVNTTVRNNIRNSQVEASNHFQKAEFSNPSFISLPLLGGLHHEEPIGGTLNIYFQAQIGLAMRWINSRSGELRGASTPFDLGVWTNLTDYSYTDYFYSSPGLAFRLAVGVIDDGHWMADLGFLFLGSFELEGYEDYEFTTAPTSYSPAVTLDGSAAFQAGTVTPMMLTLRLGYRL